MLHYIAEKDFSDVIQFRIWEGKTTLNYSGDPNITTRALNSKRGSGKSVSDSENKMWWRSRGWGEAVVGWGLCELRDAISYLKEGKKKEKRELPEGI